MWSLLFAVVMLACGLSFVVAPWMGWGLPQGESTHAREIDNLYYIILYITGFFFFLTEGLLVYFLYIYASEPGKPVRTSDSTLPPELKPLTGVVKLIPKFLHHEHRVEMAWTILPAVILIYIAVAQIDTWANVKYLSRAPK